MAVIVFLILVLLLTLQAILGLYMAVKMSDAVGYIDWRAKRVGLREEDRMVLTITAIMLPGIGYIISWYMYCKIKEMRSLKWKE